MSAVRGYVEAFVSQEERPLKTKRLDALEFVLLVVSGLTLLMFTVTVLLDVVTRLLGAPILWLQEATLIAFVWGTFIGASVAQRRREHFVVTSLSVKAGQKRRAVTEMALGLILIGIGMMLVVFGYENFQMGFGNRLPVTGLPLAALTGAIPVFGALVTVFTVERLVQGWRHGFAAPRSQLAKETDDLHGGYE